MFAANGASRIRPEQKQACGACDSKGLIRVRTPGS